MGILRALGARLLADPPRRLRVRLGFFGGEERAMLGSRVYVRRADLGGLVGVVSLELCGIGDSLALWDVTPALEATPLIRAWIAAVEALGYRRDETYHLAEPVPFFGSDHRPFVDRGVPGVGLTAIPREAIEPLRAFIYSGVRGILVPPARRPPPFTTYHTSEDAPETLEPPTLVAVERALEASCGPSTRPPAASSRREKSERPDLTLYRVRGGVGRHPFRGRSQGISMASRSSSAGSRNGGLRNGRRIPPPTPAVLPPAPLVLLVEDDHDNRAMYRQYLEWEGFRIIEASDGLEAIDRAAALLPTVIVTDLALPRLNGWEAVRRLKADPGTKHIPVLALERARLPGRRRPSAGGRQRCLSRQTLFAGGSRSGDQIPPRTALAIGSLGAKAVNPETGPGRGTGATVHARGAGR